MWNVNGKIVLITGATSGIGKANAKTLAKEGAVIFFTARDKEKAVLTQAEIIKETGNRKVGFYFCDLSSFDSVKELTRNFLKDNRDLHVLINNAGTWSLRKRLSKDGIETTFQVNYLSQVLLTLLLLDTLKKSAPSRIINVSSAMHRSAKIDLDDLEMKNHFNGIQAYGKSKLELILFTKRLAKELGRTSVTVNAVHPGLVRTNLFSNFPQLLVRIILLGALTPNEGARTSVFLATSDEVSEISGEYFAKEKVEKSSDTSFDEELQEKLWNITLKYLEKYL